MFFLFLRLPLFNNNILEDYFPLIFSNLLVILFFLFFQNSRKKADIAYQNHIARLEARSLRAQMNPHFIFNALNSLQSIMILKGERESNRYIGMLSKLLRFSRLGKSYPSTVFCQRYSHLFTARFGTQSVRAYCFPGTGRQLGKV
jgi:hypothetical protein